MIRNKMRAFLNRSRPGEKGITGLETAIILIAFVVVASVFAYTVLTAGIFSSQKGSEAVYSGLAEARATVEVVGSVTAAGVVELNDCDAPKGWVAVDPLGTDVVLTRNTTAATLYEGAADLCATITAAEGNEYWYYPMASFAVATNDTVSMWVYSAGAIASGELVFDMDSDTTISDSTTTFNCGAITAATWTNVSSSALAVGITATYFGFEYTAVTDETIYIDFITFKDTSDNSREYWLTDCDDPMGFVSSDTTNTPTARETTITKEGTASLKITTVGGALSTGDYCYSPIVTKTFATTDTASCWVYSDVGLADSDLHLAVSTDTTIAAADGDINLGVVAATTWTYCSGTFDLAVASALYCGLFYDGNAATNDYVDMIQTKAPVTFSRTKSANAWADTLSFMVKLAQNGEPVNFTPTTDADGDGELDDESTRSSYLVVNFADAYTSATDITWSKTQKGKYFGSDTSDDNVLENDEFYLVTVQLRNVNLGVTGLGKNDKKVGAKHNFTIEMKPDTGSMLTMNKTMPDSITAICDLT